MGIVTTEFILHREFVKEGEYNVAIDNVIAKIAVSRIQNIDSMRKTMGQLESVGTVETSHDCHGVVNISKVRMTFPYQREFGEPLEFKRECIPFLNRLIEVVRCKTNEYWIMPLSEHDITYFDIIEDIDETGKARKGFSFVPDALVFPIQNVDQSKVQQDISFILENDIHIPTSTTLLLDSYNYFATSQFNIAVVIANTALEIFIEEYVKVILSKKYPVETLLDEKVTLALEGKSLHHKVRRNFFKNIDHKTLMQSNEVYRKFHDFRSVRKKAVHNYKGVKMNECLNAIKEILIFIRFLQENIEDISSWILRKL